MMLRIKEERKVLNVMIKKKKRKKLYESDTLHYRLLHICMYEALGGLVTEKIRKDFK